MGMYAWYSEKQAELTGTSFYTTPNGGDVEVSTVSKDPESSGSYWDDLQYLGEVERFSHRGRPRPPERQPAVLDDIDDSFRNRTSTHMSTRMHRKGAPEPTFVDHDFGGVDGLLERLEDTKSPDSDPDPSAGIKPGGM